MLKVIKNNLGGVEMMDKIILDKITLEELKVKSAEIISKLNEINQKLDRIHNNEALSLQEYESRWNRLFNEKMQLQDKFAKLNDKLLKGVKDEFTSRSDR